MKTGVHCDFCAFNCYLSVGETGRCGVRRNIDGTIKTITHNQAVALAIDPMEKKPFYHALPTTHTLSVALFGCNFSCQFCQNATISQQEYSPPKSIMPLSPLEFATQRIERGLDSVSFTYSEPTVWQDWMIEAATEVKKGAGRCFMITNGFFSAVARDRFEGLIDGYNIDLKGDDAFYRNWCGGLKEPVMANLRALCPRSDIIVEVCTLLIEGIHTIDGILKLGEELAKTGAKVWHLSRFYPAWHMMDRQPTSEDFLEKVLEKVTSRIDIPFIYPGNSHLQQNTCCPSCQHLLIERTGGGFSSRIHFNRAELMKTGSAQCPECGHQLYLMI